MAMMGCVRCVLGTGGFVVGYPGVLLADDGSTYWV